jgi:predicted RNA-binding protein YlxR (DUF448 family)
MVRFVVGPDDQLVVDIAGKLPGRGIWVRADRSAVETAVKKKLFSRAAKQAVAVDQNLPDQVEAQLAQNCLGLLGLARRSGHVVTGFDQVVAMLEAGKAGVVLTARDAAINGRKKIIAKLKQRGDEALNIEVFDRVELSLALGRENVVHAALRSGGLTSKFVTDSVRLAGFRTSSPEAVDNQPNCARQMK